MSVDVSVVICTYNRAQTLLDALEALGAQRCDPALRWDIVIVDNNSDDDTKATVQGFAARSPVPVTYLFEGRQGKSFALNTGIGAAQGAIVALTDDDCLPQPDWVQAVANRMTLWQADGLGGRILPRWAAEPPVWLARDRHLHAFLALLTDTEVRHVELGVRERENGIRIWGSNMAFRKTVFPVVGGFNTSVGPRGTKRYRGVDVEFVRRVVGAGLKVVYDPAPTVQHRIEADRMEKSYFRKLAFDSGEGAALATGLPPGRHVVGFSLYLLRGLIALALDWAVAGACWDPEAFCKELEVLVHLGSMWGYHKEALRTSRYMSVAGPAAAAGSELTPGDTQPSSSDGHVPSPAPAPAQAARPSLDISVVVCTYNRSKMLEDLLATLDGQRVAASLSWEIVVVDNNSTDETAAVARRFAAQSAIPMTYVFEGRQGKSHALNAGIAAARGAVVAFTDDDCLAEPDWVQAVVSALERWQADGIGGRILPQWAAAPPAWLVREPHLWSSLAVMDDSVVRQVRLGPWERQHGIRIWGSNMAFQRSVFDRVGGFNTEIGPRGRKLYRGEDPEFVRRMVLAGFKVVYDPTPTVRHRIEADRMAKRYFRQHAFDSGEGQALASGLPHGRHVLGVSAYLVRRLAGHTLGWTVAGLRRDPETFCKELEVLSDLGSFFGYHKEARRTRRLLSVRRQLTATGQH